MMRWIYLLVGSAIECYNCDSTVNAECSEITKTSSIKPVVSKIYFTIKLSNDINCFDINYARHEKAFKSLSVLGESTFNCKCEINSVNSPGRREDLLMNKSTVELAFKAHKLKRKYYFNFMIYKLLLFQMTGRNET